MRALVTGATGFVGGHLVRELLANGYSVRALCRPSSRADELVALGVECVPGDITDAASVQNALSGIEAVFHVAALFREAKYPDSKYVEVNVEGTRVMLTEAEQAGVKRFMHCSTIGVHSHIPNPPADENEPYRPGDIYQVTKCEGEKLALEFFRSGRLHGAVIRPAMIWGPGDRRILKLFRGIARRRLPIIGDGNTFTHWIWVEDLARAMRLSVEAAVASGEVFIIAGDRPIPMRDLYRQISTELGVPLLPFRVPAWPLTLAGAICEAICVPLGLEPPLYRRRVYFFTKNRAFSTEKARRLLGFEPSGSFESEVAQLVAWYRAQGWL